MKFRQQDLNEWQERNFGIHVDEDMRMALGMAEEVGELCHWLLKSKQGIRGVDTTNCKPEIADAFADTVIFGIQLMTQIGVNAEDVLEETIAKILKRDWKNNPKEGEALDVRE